MTTAPPEAHTDGFSWISFLTSHPAPDNYQTVHRGCVLPATSPCCLLDKSKFKAQYDLFPVAHLSVLLHPPFLNPFKLPFHHVPGSLQIVKDSAAGDCR